jgi:hypothetical protein
VNSASYDLAKHLETQGIGSMQLGSISPGAGVGIFVGEEPPEPSESITLYMYGGTAEDGLQNSALDNFRVQVRTRARTYKDAYVLAMKVEKELNRLTTLSVPDDAATIYYQDVYRLQPVTENGFDEKHRFIFTQNFAGLRQSV